MVRNEIVLTFLLQKRQLVRTYLVMIKTALASGRKCSYEYDCKKSVWLVGVCAQAEETVIRCCYKSSANTE